MNARGRVFAPCRGARWGVFNTPLHGNPRARMDERPGTCIRPVPGRPVGRIQYAPTRVPASTSQQGRRPQHLNAPSGRMHVPGPPRVSPWAMIRRPYTGTRTNKPTGLRARMGRTRPAQGFALGYDPAPLQGARVPAPTNQTGLRARMDERPGTCIRPVPGRASADAGEFGRVPEGTRMHVPV